ncbi:DUF6653 family protein [Halosimplex pelagicum]|uniref:DUF2029 domain-containing protein n=1 Tax=Halosimplex pelagicum TaxID=869886 RepID=A0A7D5PDM9_9EURY|nr:DUF6653 family protein [Halosimplex pelagicum]QLH80419.1 hypothetical protein HZS54_01695 [Halosimplex pelagicum]
MPDATLADRYFWERHANPRSVWTLLVTYPVLVAAVYRRDRRLLACVVAFAALNPLLFPPPEDADAWTTRVVLGERAWMDDGLRSSSANAAFVALGAPLNVFTLRAAAKRRLLPTVAGTAASLAVSLLFFRQLARYYDRRTASLDPAADGRK